MALRRIGDEEQGKLTGQNRCRLHHGIGFAHVALGELPEAIEEFRKAHASAPDWPSARASLAVAELLDGNRESAFDISKEVLAADPTLHHAAAVLIDAAPAGMRVEDIEPLVPPGLRERVDIAMGLVLRARKANDPATAEAYARRALEKYPDDLRVLSILAEVMLEPITEVAGIGFTRTVPADLKHRFDEGLELLERSWEQLKTRDDIWRYDHVVANLTTALDLIGREDESERILEHALRSAPGSPVLLRRRIQMLVQKGDWAAALVTVAALPPDKLEAQDELIKVHSLLRTGKAGVALTEARGLHEKLGNDRLGEAAASLRLESAAELGQLQAEMEQTLPEFPNSIVLRSVAAGLLDEADEQRSRLISQIDRLVGEIPDLQDRFHAAEALYKAKQYSRAADLYDGLHGFDKDDPTLRRRLLSLYFADRRLDARLLFGNIDDQVKRLPQYAEIGAAIYERAGLLGESRKILEQSLLHEENLQRRLQWLSLSERLNDVDAVLGWLSKVPPDQQGRPRELMMLALAIDRYLGDPKCLPIAYRALRGAYDDPQTHMGYMSLFFVGRIGRGQITTPEQVGLDTAVVLTEKDGPRRLTRILETEPNPRADHDEVGPDDPLGGRLIGLRVGDEVKVKVLGIDSIKYAVSQIQNKFVHAHFCSVERFETMFPESRIFGSFSLDPSKGEDQFKPIFDAVKRRGEFARKIEDLYRTGHIPLAVAAKLGGSDGFELWESILGHPDLDFNVVIGSREDYAEARQTLSECRRVVVDPITLYGLVRLRIADIARSSLDDLGVVQTTIDLLRRTVQERQHARGTKQGTLGWDGEHYRMVELTPEIVEARIAEAQSALAFAESLTLLPAEAAVELKGDAKEIYGDLDDAYLDTILAAQGTGRILLTDDRAFRALAAEAVQIKGVWTQAALMSALSRQTVTPDDYCKASITLTEAGYFYTSLNAAIFRHAVGQSHWVVNQTVKKLIGTLIRPQNDVTGVVAVLGEIMRTGWAEKPGERVYEDLFVEIFIALRNAQSRKNLIGLSKMAFSTVEEALRRYLMRTRFVDELLNTTSHTSVANALAEINEVQHRIASQIAAALSNALRRAEIPECK